MSRVRLQKGFTLAELLIVVAIIAVLVAVAIPVFNSQLEKSREATDLANVRSAYAEMMTAAITEDKTAAYNGAPIYDATTGSYAVVVSLKQQKDGWQSPVPITIGGVTSGPDGGSNADLTWRGESKANGTCTVTYGPADALVLNWGEGGGSGGGNAGGSGSGEGGGSIGGGTAGTTTAFDRLVNGSVDLKTDDCDCKKGEVYLFEGRYYVCTSDVKFVNNQYTQMTPAKNATYQFRELTAEATVGVNVLTSKDVKGNGNLPALQVG